jgi:hypothetical protein
MDAQTPTPDLDPEQDGPPPDSAITRELFLEWRSPRDGRSNPEPMTNPVWAWLVRSRWNAWRANSHFEGPEAMTAGPAWCFDRFGQSVSRLPDGRELRIAGEHEDYYDPDFYIYNDVVVRHPDGQIEIFGYPRSEFPPTDFHSATVVGNRVYLIGNLGYPEHRRAGQTPVHVLDLETWKITPMATSGMPPGWISEHQAALTDDGAAILVTGGKLDTGASETSRVENLDDWCLLLDEGRWERRTVRDWPRWEVRRNDGGRLHLFEYRTALWELQYPEFRHPPLEIAGVKLPTLDEELGGAPDLALFPNRFRPELAHEVPERAPEEDFRVHRIRVAGVGVRYVEGHAEVQMTVEGHLPDDLLVRLVSDLEDKLSRLERHPCKARVLRVG